MKLEERKSYFFRSTRRKGNNNNKHQIKINKNKRIDPYLTRFIEKCNSIGACKTSICQLPYVQIDLGATNTLGLIDSGSTHSIISVSNYMLSLIHISIVLLTFTELELCCIHSSDVWYSDQNRRVSMSQSQHRDSFQTRPIGNDTRNYRDKRFVSTYKTQSYPHILYSRSKPRQPTSEVNEERRCYNRCV